MYLSVQYLRGLAALLVVFVHIEFQLKRIGYSANWPYLLEGGVDLFFVISGFVIWTVAQKQSGTVRDFAYRRIARIIPLYWLITTLIVVTALAMPSAMQSIRFDLTHALTSYLFLPYRPDGQSNFYPILVAGWTLNYEMFFYALVCLILTLPARIRFFALTLSIISIVAVGRIAENEYDLIIYWADPIILEFLYGVIIAQTTKSSFAQSATPLFLLLTSAVIVLLIGKYSGNTHRSISLGLPAFLIVLSAVTYEKSKNVPVLCWAKGLGESSYALYPTHGIVLSASLQLWRALTPYDASIILFVILATIGCILIGSFVYITFDRPVHRFLLKASIKPQTG